MNITAKSRYAMKIMMDLAENADDGIQKRHVIAERQAIPLDFMDQITKKLRTSGLIESIRGRTGGMRLGRSAKDISLWDIISTAEDHVYPVKCLEKESCALESSCISHDAWAEVYSVLEVSLSGKTLQDTVNSWKKKRNFVQRSMTAPSACS